MIGRSHGSGSDVPKLSHAEAEGLISARLDAPLDSDHAQMLAVHLRDCPNCRQFADQMELMRGGFRTLPYLPASPIVSRQVRERISQPTSFGDRIGGLFGSGSALGPMAASAALIALVIASYAIFASSAGDNGSPSTITAGQAVSTTATQPTNAGAATRETDLAAVPGNVTPGSLITPSVAVIDVRADTPEPTTGSQLSAEPTSTQRPTERATEEPTKRPTDEPTATERPKKTATTEPTETEEPSATLEPTETATKEATATVESTETPTGEPTSTREPTGTPTDEPTETETTEPTETATEEPTATDEPTETNEPSATQTDEPTQVIAPTIEPIEGSNPADEPTIIDENEPTIDDSTVFQDEPTSVDDDNPDIQPMDTPGAGHGGDEDPDPSGTSDDPQNGSGALDNSGLISSLPENTGAPTGPLRVNYSLTWMVLSSDPSGSDLLVASMSDGTIVANLGAAANPIWSPLGIVLLYQDFSNGTPAAAIFESDTGNVRRISDPDAAGAIQDVPAGWSGTAAYFLRQMPDGSISLFGWDFEGQAEFLVWDGGDHSMGGARPVPVSGGFLIPTDSEWVRVGTDGSEYSLGGNGLGISGEGFLSPFETLIAYPAGGELIIAGTEQPGVPIATIPYSGGMGSGFSWQPDGEYLVVSDGAQLAIYTYDGELLDQAVSETGVQIAAPQWLDEGIYYVESAPAASLRLLISEEIPGFNP